MKTERRAAYDALMSCYPFELADLDGEQWRPIDGYEDYYVSNFGRVKSCKPDKPPRILKPVCNRKGYLYVDLSVGGKVKHFLVHRLVAEAFIPNPENKREVNHRDGNKLNNYVNNLEWATRLENQRHAHDMGLCVSGGERSDAKLTDEEARYVRDNPDGLKNTQLAAMFDVTRTTISKIQRGKVYRNAGGVVRTMKQSRRFPEEIRAQIRAEYKRGVHGFGARKLAKKYGVSTTAILKIVKEVIE